jgi:aerobic-type carbon monoxide dehydrogenase small subunit (CoxS/CutS family)
VRDFQAEDDTPLLWVLREQLGLTGTKYGCGVAQCGACTVHIDGVPTRSCVRPVPRVGANEKIVTIEGLSPDGIHPVQKAWAALDVPQCGFCQSGMIMAATALLKAKPQPHRRRHRRGHHQHLPLRHLQPHPARSRCVARWQHQDGRRWPSSTPTGAPHERPHRPSRRTIPAPQFPPRRWPGGGLSCADGRQPARTGPRAARGQRLGGRAARTTPW